MGFCRAPLFRKRQFAAEIIVTCVRWYLRFSLSLRDVEELDCRGPAEAQGRVEERSGRKVGAESISTQEAQAECRGPEADRRSGCIAIGPKKMPSLHESNCIPRIHR